MCFKATHLHNYLILLIGLMVFSCGSKKEEVKQLIRPVQYQEVAFSGGERTRTFSGSAQTDKIINLSFRNNGIITQFNIKLGQRVTRGQLLAQLDNVQARLSYESSLASLNSAESQMNTAKLALNRIRALYEKGSAALSDFESAKNSFKTAQQSFESAKRSVAIQQEQIRYGYLYAPENGIISAVNVEIDENVQPGQTIAVLNAGSSMEISLGIPESVINDIKVAMNVGVSFSALPGEQYKGTVSEVSPSVDASTATYPVRIIVADPSSQIKSGMAANVTFNFGDTTQTKQELIVPAKAVGEDSNGRFVFLIQGDKKKATVKKQKITIGKLTSEGFEVKNGLKNGQKIAVSGLQTLLDGQEVRINN